MSDVSRFARCPLSDTGLPLLRKANSETRGGGGDDASLAAILMAYASLHGAGWSDSRALSVDPTVPSVLAMRGLNDLLDRGERILPRDSAIAAEGSD